MELNRFTDYALRTMIYAGLKEGELSSIREIASAYSISESHLVKVVHKLATLGYLETFRGRGGGIRLAHAPEAINIGEVVRAIEPLGVAECLRPDGGGCCIQGVCGLEHTLRRAQDAFLAVLDDQTLADMIVHRPPLRERLSI